MNKSYILLKLYDVLRTGGAICLGDCCSVYGFSLATFRRYMAFLRTYFMETCGREIIYDPVRAVYRLKDEADKTA